MKDEMRVGMRDEIPILSCIFCFYSVDFGNVSCAVYTLDAANPCIARASCAVSSECRGDLAPGRATTAYILTEL